MLLFANPLVWFVLIEILGLASVILAFYILSLNPRRSVNLISAFTLGLIGLTIFTASGLYRTGAPLNNSFTGAVFLSVFPALSPALSLMCLALLKPGWLTLRHRWLTAILILLILIPVLLTLVDLLSHNDFYCTDQIISAYRAGFLFSGHALGGLIGQLISYLYLILIPILLLLLLLYLSFLDHSLEMESRILARLLLVFQVLVVACIFTAQYLPLGAYPLVLASLCLIGYGLIAYRQLTSDSCVVVGRLKTRLAWITLIITIPVLVFLAISLTQYARDLITENAHKTLQSNATSLKAQVETWLDDNVSMIRTLAALPDILSLDPVQHESILNLYAKQHPSLSLISTIDTEGINIARSDAAAASDYREMLWFQRSVRGEPVSVQITIDPLSNQPSLIASVPIYQTSQEVIGVAMFSTLLVDLSNQFTFPQLGKTGVACVIDDTGQLITSQNEKANATELVDFNTAQPVQAMLSQITPPYIYTDDSGVVWHTYYESLDNNWAVIVQQEESEILQPYRAFQLLSGLLVGIGMVVIVSFVLASLKHAINPIVSLIKTVQAVTAGDLEQKAVIESEDEIGTLARAFNDLTAQARTLIGDLEQRVSQRTLELERRSTQLQAAAEVGHASATIRNLDELLPLVTRLISERFGFYHVGIFLLDDKYEYAVLRAANSSGGQRMLARGHKLKVGQQGIVGYVTAKREPRVVLNVGDDVVFFNNPDLPDTQAEMALPLVVGDELLGALDVQSEQSNAFSPQDIETLQVLADQVAIAINSVQLLQQSIELLESERRLISEVSQRDWSDQVRAMRYVGYARERTGLYPLSAINDPQTEEMLSSGQVAIDREDPSILYVPVIVRGMVIGLLKLEHEQEAGGWSKEEIEIMRSFAEQLGVALESARSYQQTQLGAQRDRTLSELGAKIRETLDIHTILRTATQEIRQVLNLPKVVIRMGVPPQNLAEDQTNQAGDRDDREY